MPDWEQKERRIAWENINSGCCAMKAARINAGLDKEKTMKDSMDDVRENIGIHFQAFLNNIPQSENQEQPIQSSNLRDEDKNRVCERCHRHGKQTSITQGVADFSMENYGEQLCMDCQKEVRKKK